MALRYTDVNGVVRDKVQIAIDRFKAFEPEEGQFLAFSGGKDSQCIYHLAEMAGVKFDAHYNITSVDPPELVRFIKQQYPDVHLDFPRDKDGNRVSMWNLIPQKNLPPTRLVRYCCEKLKEASGKGRIVVTGVRWAESPRRKNSHGVVDLKTQSKKLINRALDENDAAALTKSGHLVMNDDNDESRRMVEQCYRTKRTMLNPIIDWDEDDVWEFLNDVAKVPHCCLYDEGFTRLGCIGCPMQGRKGMERDFKRWPKYRDAYIRAFERMIDNHGDDVKIIQRLKEEHFGMDDIDLGLSLSLERERERERPAVRMMRWWMTLDGVRLPKQ